MQVGSCMHICSVFAELYTVSRKNIPDIFDCNLNQLSDFDNFWYEYSWHNLASNYHSAFHLTKCMLLHCLGKSDQAKYVLK